MRNKVYSYLNSFLSLSRMSKRTRNKVSYNVDEALRCLLESDEKDLGQLEDDNDGDSSTDSEYNDANLFSIATNLSIPGAEHDDERVEFVVQEERPKRKRNIGRIMSLDTSLDETNYDAFDPPIPEECLESNIDETPYKWTASTVSSGRFNAAHIMPLHARPQAPEEVRSNGKYTYFIEVTEEELLAFFGISYARSLLGQNFLKLRLIFSVDVGYPIFSPSVSFNSLVFIRP